MAQKEGAPLILVGLANAVGDGLQPAEAAEKAAIGRVVEPDGTGPAPTALAQSVEAPVVPHAKGGVGLCVVSGETTELSPSVEESWPADDNRGHSVANISGIGGEGGDQRGQGFGRLRIEHGFGWARRGQANGLIVAQGSSDSSCGRVDHTAVAADAVAGCPKGAAGSR